MNDSAVDDLVRIRTKLLDLQRTGVLSAEGFPTYQQTILQILQECERRKQGLFSQVQTLRAQASAAESQAHAFSAMGSILYNIINGYVENEQRRIEEEQRRAAERENDGQPEVAVSASGAVIEPLEPSVVTGPAKPRRGRPPNKP